MQTAKTKRKIETDEELLEMVGDLDGFTIHHLLSTNGDDTQRLAWDPRDLDQIKEARDKFYDMIDNGYMAFSVDPETGEQKNRKIIEFQPGAGEIIFTFKDAVEATRTGRKVVAQPAVAAG